MTFGFTSCAPDGLEKIGAVSAECTVSALPEVTKVATSRSIPSHQVRDSLNYSLSMLQTLGVLACCLRPWTKSAMKSSTPAILLMLSQGDRDFWDREDPTEENTEQTQLANSTFDVEGPLDTKAIVRKIDRHLLPLLFSLALLCSVDRGEGYKSTLRSALPRQSSCILEGSHSTIALNYIILLGQSLLLSDSPWVTTSVMLLTLKVSLAPARGIL